MKKLINNETLKIVAIIAMVMDHISFLFFDSSSAIGIIFRIFGRITFPIFAFLIAEGFHKSKNPKKYLIRLGILAIISHFAFTFFSNVMIPTSTMFTLFLGLLAIIIFNEKETLDIRIAVIIIIVLLGLFGDYGIWGVLLILLFELFYKKRNLQIIAFFIMAIIRIGLSYGSIAFYINMGLILVIPFFYLYNDKRKGGKMSKWFFYFFYPLHMILLKIIYLIIS